MRLAFAALALAFSAALHADTPPAPPAPPPPGETCKQAPFHQFDFWIGEWDVTEHGKPAGHSRIEPILLHCAISENWTSAQGGDGKSYNAYDPQTRQWTQFWVSVRGNTLLLHGGLEGQAMVLSGDHVSPQSGKTTRERITWSKNADGSVRQLWDQSEDGGQTWTVAFDGLYRPAKPPAPKVN